MDRKQSLKDEILEIDTSCINIAENPDKIYHYTDVNGIYNIINNKSFWLTKSDFLNDEKELVYFYKILKIVLKENEFENINFDFVEWLKVVASESLKNVFILSFSTEKDSLPLWEMYANGNGYNMEIQYNKYFNEFWNKNIFVTTSTNEKIYMTRKNDSGKFCGVEEFVVYDETVQKNRVKELLEGIDKSIEFVNEYNEDTKECGLVRELQSRIASELINCMMLFKDKSFSYEKEYRIVYNIIDCDELDIVKHRISNGRIIPYIELGFENMFIESIRVSPRLKNDILSVKGLTSFINKINRKNGSQIEIIPSESSIR